MKLFPPNTIASINKINNAKSVKEYKSIVNNSKLIKTYKL